MEQNEIVINYINTKDFTKALIKFGFENHQARLGMTLTIEDVIAEVEG